MNALKKQKKAFDDSRRWMRHKLYGDVPLVRHESVVGGKSYEYWRWDPTFKPKLPRGAVEGDASKQVHCPCHTPKYFYVDETRHCVQCDQDFPFSGREQKYWYEVRKFNFHSVPIRCPKCRRLRRSEHALREQIARARAETAKHPDAAAAQLALARAVVEYHERTGRGRLQDAIAAARRARRLRPDLREAAAWEAKARSLLKVILCAALVAAIASLHAASQDRLTSGAVITKSTRIPTGVHELKSADREHPALIIRGSNITVDFSGVTLLGGRPDADPDSYSGLAVLVDGGENVTIRNLTARGYKIGVHARKSPRIHITGADLSYNWKARLYSLVEHESLVDWMSYHHNDKDEWLDQGAGIYLADSDGAEIDGTTVVQGQNGLMLARTNGARIWNDNFSFNSGIGIGLYRSSGNTIQHNRVDFDVRGYSHTFYNRGQDSAGILIYEQSNRNIVAFNSVTHGGDGLFLWAGQTTMDTGEGGANDNVFYDNDFSFAPTNGMEATFSRNIFYGNRVEECWHGLWGGYSFDSWIAANRFARNVEAIAIEHGQDNRITENLFDRDETAIRLWKNATQDPDWAYPKRRDTRSRDYVIAGNTFAGNQTALKITETQNVRVLTNTFEKVGTVAVLNGDTRNLGIGDEVTVPVRGRPTIDATLPKPLPGGMDAKTPDAERRGRDAIVIDEWGPYDSKSPKLWPDGRSDATPLRLRVLGPAGDWKVASVRGATIEPASGRVPGLVTVTPSIAKPIDFDVRLTYTGAAVVGPRGETVRAGMPYSFGYSRFFVPIDWQIRYFTFDETARPDKNPDAFARLLAGAPLKTDRRDRLDYMSGGAIAEGLPRDRVAIVAQGEVDLPAGQYTVRTISDDGVRVSMDDKRIVDHWTPHESAIDTVPITGGKRRFKVEYFELGGFAELRFEILKRPGA